eukprot:3257884-Pleurochrysis_carterae.AAC.1
MFPFALTDPSCETGKLDGIEAGAAAQACSPLCVARRDDGISAQAQRTRRDGTGEARSCRNF